MRPGGATLLAWHFAELRDLLSHHDHMSVAFHQALSKAVASKLIETHAPAAMYRHLLQVPPGWSSACLCMCEASFPFVNWFDHAFLYVNRAFATCGGLAVLTRLCESQSACEFPSLICLARRRLLLRLDQSVRMALAPCSRNNQTSLSVTKALHVSMTG